MSGGRAYVVGHSGLDQSGHREPSFVEVSRFRTEDPGCRGRQEFVGEVLELLIQVAMLGVVAHSPGHLKNGVLVGRGLLV